MPGDGKTVHTVYAVDNAGNQSATLTFNAWIDTTAPVGTIQINGDASYTISNLVDLNLSASDTLSGVTEMRFSNDGLDWSAWETYDTSVADWDFTLYGGNSNPNEFHTVYVAFRDGVGLEVQADDAIYFLEEIVADDDELTASAGGMQTVNFDLAAGPEFANRAYSFYGSTTGGSYPLPGGLVSLPFASDAAMSTISGQGFPGFEGVFDTVGRSEATMNVPPGAIAAPFIGRTLMFAFATHDGTGNSYDHVSYSIETVHLAP